MILLIGNETDDVMIYLATILKFAHIRVAIIDLDRREEISRDCNETKNSNKINECNDIKESWKELIEQHRGVDYLCGQQLVQQLVELEDNFRKEYDIILLRAKDGVPTELLIRCEKLFCCMDFQKSELEKLEEIVLHKKPDVIMLRNTIPCKIKPNFILRQYYSEGAETKIILVPFQKKDRKYKLENEYRQRIRFSHLSRNLRKGILEILEILVPELKNSERNRVYRGAGKGK